jgi:hypothetical protein
MPSRLIYLFLVLAACAPTGPTVPEKDRTERPRLIFAASGHEFGRQERHRTLTHSVTFVNGGRAPLAITRIETNCGCAAALLSRRTIPPGGRGTIEITWQTGGVAGKRTKTMEVTTNDPVNPVARYPMTIEVVGDAFLDPTVVAVRGTRAEGDIESWFDVVALDAGEKLRITGVRTSHEGITARVSSLPPGDKRTGYRVHLSFGPALGAGSFHERVSVLTNSRRDPTLTIDVIGSVARQVLAVPERIFFPRVTGSVSRIVRLARRDGKPLAVLDVADPSGLLVIETERMAPDRWEVRARLAGENPAAGVRSSLVIRTDAQGDATITVPVTIAAAAE